MFATCPHCQFLVAQHPQTRALPPACPRCGKALGSESPATTTPSLATYLQPAATGIETSDDAPAAGATDTAQGDARPTVADETVAIDSATPIPSDAADVSVEPGPRDDADLPASSGEAASPDEAASTIVTRSLPPASPAPATRATPAPMPRFTRAARTTPVHARAARWQWGVLAALLLLLCMQVVLADRDRLATQAAWRPVVMALCGIFRCDVPIWREPAAFAMLSRDVRPVPGAPGQLQAQATFRNDARWTQAWPVILLTLKDADGRTLGARALQPGDYLTDEATQDGIAPGQSAQVAVRVREPSANVVAFSFDFR